MNPDTMVRPQDLEGHTKLTAYSSPAEIIRTAGEGYSQLFARLFSLGRPILSFIFANIELPQTKISQILHEHINTPAVGIKLWGQYILNTLVEHNMQMLAKLIQSDLQDLGEVLMKADKKYIQVDMVKDANYRIANKAYFSSRSNVITQLQTSSTDIMPADDPIMLELKQIAKWRQEVLSNTNMTILPISMSILTADFKAGSISSILIQNRLGPHIYITVNEYIFLESQRGRRVYSSLQEIWPEAAKWSLASINVWIDNECILKKNILGVLDNALPAISRPQIQYAWNYTTKQQGPFMCYWPFHLGTNKCGVLLITYEVDLAEPITERNLVEWCKGNWINQEPATIIVISDRKINKETVDKLSLKQLLNCISKHYVYANMPAKFSSCKDTRVQFKLEEGECRQRLPFDATIPRVWSLIKVERRDPLGNVSLSYIADIINWNMEGPLYCKNANRWTNICYQHAGADEINYNDQVKLIESTLQRLKTRASDVNQAWKSSESKKLHATLKNLKPQKKGANISGITNKDNKRTTLSKAWGEISDYSISITGFITPLISHIDCPFEIEEMAWRGLAALCNATEGRQNSVGAEGLTNGVMQHYNATKLLALINLRNGSEEKKIQPYNVKLINMHQEEWSTMTFEARMTLVENYPPLAVRKIAIQIAMWISDLRTIPKYVLRSKFLPLNKVKKDLFPTVDNIRPIMLGTWLSKAIDSMFRAELLEPVAKTIHDRQYGFIGKRSTTHAAFDLWMEIQKASRKKRKLKLYLLDLSKAFDRVDRYLLSDALAKAAQLAGVAHYEWWVQALINRLNLQQTNFGDQFIYNAETGVPQGSIISPELFAVFVNDLRKMFMEELKVDSIYFADDTILVQAGEGQIIDWNAINNVLNGIKMKLNAAKSVFWANKNCKLAQKTDSFIYLGQFFTEQDSLAAREVVEAMARAQTAANRFKDNNLKYGIRKLLTFTYNWNIEVARIGLLPFMYPKMLDEVYRFEQNLLMQCYTEEKEESKIATQEAVIKMLAVGNSSPILVKLKEILCGTNSHMEKKIMPWLIRNDAVSKYIPTEILHKNGSTGYLDVQPALLWKPQLFPIDTGYVYDYEKSCYKSTGADLSKKARNYKWFKNCSHKEFTWQEFTILYDLPIIMLPTGKKLCCWECKPQEELCIGHLLQFHHEQFVQLIGNYSPKEYAEIRTEIARHLSLVYSNREYKRTEGNYEKTLNDKVADLKKTTAAIYDWAYSNKKKWQVKSESEGWNAKFWGLLESKKTPKIKGKVPILKKAMSYSDMHKASRLRDTNLSQRLDSIYQENKDQPWFNDDFVEYEGSLKVSDLLYSKAAKELYDNFPEWPILLPKVWGIHVTTIEAVSASKLKGMNPQKLTEPLEHVYLSNREFENGCVLKLTKTKPGKFSIPADHPTYNMVDDIPLDMITEETKKMLKQL